MNLDFISSPKNTASKLTYDVLIENELDGTVKATLLDLPDYQCFGATQEEAINNLIKLFQERNPKILILEEILPPKIESPLMEVGEILNAEGNAWDVLEALTGTIEAPSDWSSQHNHYLYGTPKNPDEIIE
ncbi:hypothetical protein Nos7524_5334 [Nostoc sp. PCC 7524]|uniref:type II toxin-antitoxin system HicB family antitoxin n=1 Tax=Nostoc sp. (strain ATCC 29411 / PCC 7524) TaxID=28072 RepID=UPI00029ED845|nr:hypothetical protein [Nostoc sp. PCC 7524]AFY51053.1 hypothetical protein Nos7524_5334 [Nostoc sp. PCC 7524]